MDGVRRTRQLRHHNRRQVLHRSGQSNPVHHHPNCDEVLHVLRGSIRHRVDDEYVEMGPGDTISIPQGAIHHADNVGDDVAEFIIVFSTARRQVVGE